MSAFWKNKTGKVLTTFALIQEFQSIFPTLTQHLLDLKQFQHWTVENRFVKAYRKTRRR